MLIQFHPNLIGGEQDTVTFTYTYFDSTFTRTIALSGAGKASGTLQYDGALDFGIASLCSPVDSEITFINQSCDTAYIDSVSVIPPFMLLSKLPVKLLPGTNASLRVQYSPHAVTEDTGIAIATLSIHDSLVRIHADLHGHWRIDRQCAISTNFQLRQCIYLLAARYTNYIRQVKLRHGNNRQRIRYAAVYAAESIIAHSQSGAWAADAICARHGSNRHGAVQGTDMVKAILGYILSLLQAMGKQQAPCNMLVRSDFGTTSLCSWADSQIIFSNLTMCYQATVDSVSVAAAIRAA